jgi:hypothetical protein
MTERAPVRPRTTDSHSPLTQLRSPQPQPDPVDLVPGPALA